jgi:succinate dehydrogenase/fumarate reductase flavoprotein subunit
LLDGQGQEFLAGYGSDETSGYATPRDTLTYAIVKRSRPPRHAAWRNISVVRLPPGELQAAFGPVIERLAKNGIDLGHMAVEVAPSRTTTWAASRSTSGCMPGRCAVIPACTNGANRPSGNAIPEALVFGERAGRFAAPMPRPPRGGGVRAGQLRRSSASASLPKAVGRRRGRIARQLRELMWNDVGPFRSAAGLRRALVGLAGIKAALPDLTIAPGRVCNVTLADCSSCARA